MEVESDAGQNAFLRENTLSKQVLTHAYGTAPVSEVRGLYRRDRKERRTYQVHLPPIAHRGSNYTKDMHGTILEKLDSQTDLTIYINMVPHDTLPSYPTFPHPHHDNTLVLTLHLPPLGLGHVHLAHPPSSIGIHCDGSRQS